MKINQAFTILQSAGGIRAARIITENTTKLSRVKIWWMARQLRRGVPVAKIIHQKWFYGLKFYTNRWTLDPRPDTETLVSAVISDMHNDTPPKILDLGTGTGCVIISLCQNISGAHGIGVERSHMAALVARKNVRRHNAPVTIRRGSFNAANVVREKFDIIVSNPPYIARGDDRVDAGAMHDPATALFAKDDGYAAYQTIAKNAKNWIISGGKIYLEIGIDMDVRVREIFESAGWKFERAESDLGGITRVMVFSL